MKLPWRNACLRAPQLGAWLVLTVLVNASAGTLSDPALLVALQHGGYVLVMRHANSPLIAPDKSAAEPDNVNLERQLDETGRNASQAMGEAIRKLHIPIGTIWSSPTYRTLETIRLLGLGMPNTVSELGEGGQGMRAQDTDAKRSAWMRHAVTVTPRAGTNTLIVTHTPNIVGAFGQEAANIAAGETLVFQPDGKGSVALVTRIKIEEWSHL
jgi:phosphohistidine phosphatase SixA